MHQRHNEVTWISFVHHFIKKGTQFTSHFRKIFQSGIGTKVKLSTTFSPKTDGQEEHTIQTLEDMLGACIINFKGNWDNHLPLIEFSYNNSYHLIIAMAPFEALGTNFVYESLEKV